MKTSKVRTAVRKHRGSVYIKVTGGPWLGYCEVAKLHVLRMLDKAPEDTFKFVEMYGSLFIDGEYFNGNARP